MFRSALKIKVLLPVVITTSALLIVTTSALQVQRALERRAASDTFLDVNAASEFLLTAAANLAVERGATNTALNAPQPISAERRDSIAERRAAADKAMRNAFTLLHEIPAMREPAGQQALAAAEQAHRGHESLRQRADASLAQAAGNRAAQTLAEFFPTITGLIDTTATLRLTLETLSRPPTAALSQVVQARALAADAAEYAGRERAAYGP